MNQLFKKDGLILGMLLKFRLIVFFPIFLWSNAQAQTEFTPHGFEKEIIGFQPIKRSGVSTASFEKAIMILDDTRSATKGNPANFNVADYWNTAVVLSLLNEAPNAVLLAFDKAASLDGESLCAYIKALGGGRIRAKIPERFDDFVSNCQPKSSSEQYSIEKELLPKLMREINDSDQKYRNEPSTDKALQALEDQKNQKLIDSIYTVYGSYIGNREVGKDLEHVMWAVIQHSNLEMMERYLPVVAEATKNGNLSSTVPLKMLIDRIYAIKSGKQIFGSQSNIPLAQKAIREEVIRVYGL